MQNNYVNLSNLEANLLASPINNNNNSRHNNNNTGNCNNNNNNMNNHSSSNNSSNNHGNAQSNHINAEDICPIHGGHKWKDCFLNPNGNNYRPRNVNTSSNRSNNRGDSHATNTATARRTVTFADNNNNTQNGNNNHNNSNPQENHHIHLVPDGGNDDLDWQNDHFIFNANLELDPVEVEMESTQSPCPVIEEPILDNPTPDLVPSTILSVKTVGGASRPRPLIALFDSGGSHVMISRNAIPKKAIETIDERKSFTTTAGELHSLATVQLSKIFLPEFSHV